MKSIHDQATPKLQAIDRLRGTPRVAVSLGHGIPSTVTGAEFHVDSAGWRRPGTGSQGYKAGNGTQTFAWANYAYHPGSGSTATVTLAVSGASADAQVGAYWNGVLLGTKPASGTVSFGSVDVDPHMLHGLIVRAVSGSFNLDSIDAR